MNFMGKQWRYKSAGRVLDEIDILAKKHSVRELWILDDNFTWKKERVLEICEGIQKRNYKFSLRFPNGVRADRVDKEILTALKNIGCYNIAFGVESGNQEILDHLGKGERLEQIQKAIATANELKLLTSGFFVLGLPGETEATINDSIKFAKSTGLSDASFFIATPYPGTKLWDMTKGATAQNWNSYDQDALIPMSCSNKITPERLVELVRIANRKFFLRPKVLLHIVKYLFNPASLGIFKNKLFNYLGLRTGNV